MGWGEMLRFDSDTWTRERADRYEGLLAKLLTGAPSVGEIGGSSNEDYRDYKVYFYQDSNRLVGGYLEFNPRTRTLNAHATERNSSFLDGVVGHLSRQLPNVGCVKLEPQPGNPYDRDVRYVWIGVGERTLRRAVGSAMRRGRTT